MKLLTIMLPTLAVTFLTFMLMQAAGGDAADMLYLESVPEELKELKRAELGLNQNLAEQYLRWLMSLLSGNLGNSLISGQSVAEIFLNKLPGTALLMASSLSLTLLISIPLGILTAVKSNRTIDWLIRSLCFVGNSIPHFVAALMLMYIFSLKLRILPTTGGVVLPCLTLTIAMSSKYIRIIRALVIEELRKPYVAGAMARGVGVSTILFRHVFKCTLPPLISLIGLSVGSLMGGVAVVESVFMFDGLGYLLVHSVLMRDFPVIQAYVVFLSVLYRVIHLISERLSQLVDPRIAAD